MNSYAEVKQRIVDDWQIVVKFWSVKFQALSTLILGWVSLFPDQLYQGWQSLPPEVVNLIPAKFVPIIGIVLYGCGLFSRFLKQKSVEIAKRERDAKSTATV